jgi:hypothetical protein
VHGDGVIYECCGTPRARQSAIGPSDLYRRHVPRTNGAEICASFSRAGKSSRARERTVASARTFERAPANWPLIAAYQTAGDLP